MFSKILRIKQDFLYQSLVETLPEADFDARSPPQIDACVLKRFDASFNIFSFLF
jgi:hypothetical protein